MTSHASSATEDSISVPVPLFETHRQYQAMEYEIAAAVGRVCTSGRYILGPECERLEQSLARYCGTAHALGCASGSDALLLALAACGVTGGDEVILPSYTFFATASAPWRLGARPVFVDIDPVTFNIDHRLIEAAITPRTKAIIPVHLYGQCAEMDPIVDIARRHHLPVIEDAAQAIGAGYRGRRAGSLGDVGCLSFYPTKNLGAFGDGGMLTTDRADLADRLSLLRAHGMRPRYYHQVVGINSRLDAIQAAILAVKLPRLDKWTAMRQCNADHYAELFADCGLDRILTLPSVAPNRRHVWNQYVVRVPDGRRDALQAHLASRHIGTEVYYPVPLHEQECFRSLEYAAGSLPQTERAARETLALPIFPELNRAEQARVVRAMAAFFGVVSPTSGHGIPRPKFLGLETGDRTTRRQAEMATRE